MTNPPTMSSININDISYEINSTFRICGIEPPPKRQWFFVVLHGDKAIKIAKRVGIFSNRWQFDDGSKLGISKFDKWARIPTFNEIMGKK